MKLIQLAVLLVAFTLVAVSETAADRSAAKTLATQMETCAEAVQTGATGDRLAQQQACCKGHKGVCGCRAGKIVCCDKTFSDTCTCNRDDDPGSAS